MGCIRPFTDADVPQVANLHRSVFRTAHRADSGLDGYRTYFTRVFLENPARDASLPSLVYEEKDGRIAGFLGVVPRRMTINGQHVRAAISSQFVVDPSSQVGLIAVRLAKAFLEGGQDLSISDEASDISRKIWEGLGGATALLHSLRWTRPLQPARFALSFLRERPGMSPVAMAADPLARIMDSMAARLTRGYLYAQPPEGSVQDELSETVFLAYLPELAGAQALRMDYDALTYRWLIALARRRKAGGRLRTAVITKGQSILGWYVFHVNDDQMAEVLQIAAEPSSIAEVLDHLFSDAVGHGAIAVTGRLEPRFLQSLSDKHCLFHRRGPWVLVSARRPELVRGFQTGEAFFSRFDGEWCLGF